MKKNGFSLIELLAVVAIIGILILVIAPNVIKTMKKSKQNTFITETREVCKAATNTYIKESVSSLQGNKYYKIKNDKTHALDLSGRDEFNYYVKVNTDGTVIQLFTWDGTNTIKMSDINGINTDTINKNSIRNDIPTQKLNTVNNVESLFNNNN